LRSPEPRDDQRRARDRVGVVAAALSWWALGLRRRAGRFVASEAHFRELVEAADDIIFRTDAEGRFAYANPAAEEALGSAERTLLGRPFLDVVRADYREEARRFYEDQRHQGILNTYCEFRW